MAPYPMIPYNGMEVASRNRRAPSSDISTYPEVYRQYINASGLQDVQIKNGLAGKRLSGVRLTYKGSGWLSLSAPTTPGLTRGDVGGFHKRGPAPQNIQNLFDNGPGSQPDNPGGPGRIAAPSFINPGTG
jgi:hypothetical protein